MERDVSRQDVLGIVERTAAQRGIPRDDFLRFAYIETGGRFDERAFNASSGAAGLFQFVPGTASAYGIRGREFDPAANADAGARLYIDNRNDIIASQQRSGRPFLSGEAQPSGLDLYLAHQQGAYGYRSIQAAIATGQFFGDTPTRRNLIANVGGDLEAVTGVTRDQFRQMGDRELAQTFVNYWETKYDRIRIPEMGIEPRTGAAQPNPPGATAPARSGAMADGLLREGESGPAVRQLQERLNTLGLRDAQGRPLATDGEFGARTEQAVIAFQRARGLAPDGIAGPRTLSALEQPNPVRSNPGAPAPAVPTPTEPASAAALRSGWPVPGRTAINLADRPGEGGGEFGEARSGGREHKGIDINGRVGDRVESFAPGQVVFTGQMRGFGNTVIIQHEGGVQTVYAHLDRITVNRDQQVDRTTQIGTMGRSGNTPSAGDTHLHFEIREGANGTPLSGRAVDPRRYLNFEGETSRRVGEIQQQLQRLDVRDARGQPIVADMSYGARTREAVESFQRSRGIEVTGIVDPSTFDALRRAQPQTRPAEAAPRAAGEPAADARAVALANPLVREASAALARDQPGLGAEQRLQAAVALADAASRRGLTGIDSVAAGPNGALFAIQGDPRRDDAQQAVATRERLAQPIELGVAQLAEQERQRAASVRAELPAEHREVRSPNLA